MVSKSNTNNISFNKLSILIDQDGFSFYLNHNKPSNSKSFEPILVDDIFLQKSLNTFKQKLNEICREFNVNQIKLAFANELFSLVPEEFFDKTLSAEYLKFNVQLFEGDQIEAEYISAINSYLIYVPLMNYHNLVLEQVEEFEYIHFTQALIEDAEQKSLEDKQKMKVFIRNKQLDILAFDGKDFKMSNTYNYTTDLDIAYYILFTIEELRFNQYKMGLYVSHNLKEHNFTEILNRYVQHVYCHQENLTTLIK